MSRRRERRTAGEEDEVVPAKRRRNVISDEKENHDDSNISMVESSQNPSTSKSITNYDDVQDKIARNLKSGKIRKISLKNFMCHRNFEVDMNDNINVFCGDNGSGKSAILAALAIGLGSKASSTSRSTSLKELVRRGEPSAQIEIVLANDGVDSFEHDVYGDEITVVRTISAAGSTSYKLKSDSGRIITTSRSDLNKLTLCLNIQVENPVLLLNQDAARSFLKECDPKKLYQLFLKATQIETIIDKLNACFQTSASSRAQLDNINRSIQHISKEVAELDEKYTRLQSVETIKEEIEQFQNQLNWLRVSVVEKEMGDCAKEMTQKKSEVEKLNSFVTNKKSYEAELKQKIAELGQTFLEKQGELTGKTSEYETRKQAALQSQEKLAVVERALKKAEGKKGNIDSDIRQLEADIQEKEQNPLNVDNQKRQNEQRLEELQGTLVEVQSMMDSAKRDIQMLSDTVESNKERMNDLKSNQGMVRNNISKISDQIKQIDLSAKDSLSLYGQQMPRLVKRLKDMAGQFSKEPRGPLGQYIQIPNKRYRNIVEHHLGAFIHSFYVNSDQDRILLGNILKREFPELASRSTIITGRFTEKLYDLKNGRCNPPRNSNAMLLMDLIRVKDPVVMNCLVDQKNIESILVVEDTDLAIHLTSERSNVPNNLNKVLLLHPSSEYYPAPGYRTYAMNVKNARFLQVNKQEIKQQLEVDKQQEEAKYHDLQQQIQHYADQVKETGAHLRAKQENLSKIKRKYEKISKEIDEINKIEYPAENENEYLKEELEKLSKMRDKIMNEIAEEKSKKQVAEAELREREAALKEYKKNMKGLENSLNAAQQEIDNVKAKINELNTDVRFKKNQISGVQDELSGLERNYQQFQAKVDALIGHTQRDRVDTNKSEEKLIQMIKKNERRINQIQSSNEDIDVIKQLLDNRKDHFSRMKMISDSFGFALRKLTEIRESRFRFVKKLKQHMSLKVKHKFNTLMSLRNYTAEVEINNQEKTLELKVIPRDAAIKGAVSNTKSLSGGERSFSTVAFLIALWSCVDHPFYFLDEYDVFSDDYNRHIMTMLLFDEAKKKKDKQYGFLTPQDLTNIQASEQLTIHKLQDPKRC